MEVILLDDSELVSRTIAGDSKAYEALFERHRYPLRTMLQAKCAVADNLTAYSYDDILQETFVKAYLNLSQFNPAYEFGQWIFTIAKNLFIDYARRNNQIEKCSLSQEMGAICSASPNPEEQVIAEQYKRRLRQALTTLTPAYQTIIELRFWCDMSYDQIAEKLGMPIGTVKTQIHRARLAFIHALGDGSAL